MRTLLAALLILAAVSPAGAQTSDRECLDSDGVDGVTLQACTWQEGGVWHLALTVSNDAATAKEVAVACQHGGIGQVIVNSYDPGAAGEVLTGTLPQAVSRPESPCQIDSVEDWQPSSSDTPEE